ncbi:MAG: hypothetical protein ACLPID_21030 [Beijerinckiaceae bacterium]
MPEQPSEYASAEEHLIETLHILAKQNDTPYVIVAASALEDLLETVLRENMRDLSKPPYSELFGSRGFLSTFGAKISIAYAFKIISDDLVGDFEAVRKIRNAFAHARGPIQFGSPNPELKKAFKAFSGWTESSDQRTLFCAVVRQPPPNGPAFIAEAVKATWATVPGAKVPRSVGPDDPLCRFVTASIKLAGKHLSVATVSDMLRGRNRRKKSEQAELSKTTS